MKSKYFPHDYHARADEKLQALQQDHGLAGIGAYWCIIEMIYEGDGSIKNNPTSMAFSLHTETNFISEVLSNYDLFVVSGDQISSISAQNRIKEIAQKSEKARESISKRWDKKTSQKKSYNGRITNVSNNDTIVSNSDTNVCENDTIERLSDTNVILLNEIKLNKTKIQEKEETAGAFAPAAQGSFVLGIELEPTHITGEKGINKTDAKKKTTEQPTTNETEENAPAFFLDNKNTVADGVCVTSEFFEQPITPAEKTETIEKKEKASCIALSYDGEQIDRVKITADQYKKLLDRYEESDILKTAAQLDNYTGLKKYKDHYKTLLNWLRMGEERGTISRKVERLEETKSPELLEMEKRRLELSEKYGVAN